MSASTVEDTNCANTNKLTTYQPVCQRCFNPLQLDQDFEHLQKTELMTLIDATNSDCEPPAPMNLVPIRHSSIPHPRYMVSPNPTFCAPFDDDVFDAFSLLQSYSGPTSSLDHRLKVNACLFDILSGRTEVDHPLCKECADTLLAAKQQCLEFQEEELSCLRFYLNYLDTKAAKVEAKLKAKQHTTNKNLPNIRPKTPSNDTSKLTDPVALDRSQMSSELLADSLALQLELNESIDDLNAQDDDDDDDDDDSNIVDHLYDDDDNALDLYDEDCREGESKSDLTSVAQLEQTLSQLQKTLDDLLEEGQSLDSQIQQDTAELGKRNEELDRATMQYNDQKLALMASEDQMLGLEMRLNYAKSHLNRLQRSNVLNIAFPIWYDGHIGVINGLHLGRLANRPVGWEEINAAWGQCALLLQCVGKKLNYTFQNFHIIPMGSQSKIVQLSGDKEYPLYYTTGGMRLLSAGKFDTAMFNFLDCLNQVQQIVERSSNIQLPHRIKDRGKLQDPDGQIYSIRWNGNTEENWTKALKMMLINMKWIIAGLSMRRNTSNAAKATRSTRGSGNEAKTPPSESVDGSKSTTSDQQL